jgi:hypothetical protein
MQGRYAAYTSGFLDWESGYLGHSCPASSLHPMTAPKDLPGQVYPREITFEKYVLSSVNILESEATIKARVLSLLTIASNHEILHPSPTFCY